jgi:hypothetical protein
MGIGEIDEIEKKFTGLRTVATLLVWVGFLLPVAVALLMAYVFIHDFDANGHATAQLNEGTLLAAYSPGCSSSLSANCYVSSCRLKRTPDAFKLAGRRQGARHRNLRA